MLPEQQTAHWKLGDEPQLLGPGRLLAGDRAGTSQGQEGERQKLLRGGRGASLLGEAGKRGAEKLPGEVSGADGTGGPSLVSCASFFPYKPPTLVESVKETKGNN